MEENPNQVNTLQPVRKVLPLIPLRNIVLFPSVETSLFFGRKESRKSEERSERVKEDVFSLKIRPIHLV